MPEMNQDFRNFIAHFILKFRVYRANDAPGSDFEYFMANLCAGKEWVDCDYLKIDEVQDGQYNNDQLMAMTKAGSYLRYILRKNPGWLEENSESYEDYFNEILEYVDMKWEDDHPSKASIEEVEKIIDDTGKILEEAEAESEESNDDNDSDSESNNEETKEEVEHEEV